MSQHLQINVKSNIGFFPSGDLLVYELGPSNEMLNAELMSHHNGAAKVKVPAPNEFHVTVRGAPAATFKQTPIVAHPAGSIVTGPDTYYTCRNSLFQPGVDVDLTTPGIQEPVGQVVGTSVGGYAACYTQTEPSEPPKTLRPKKLSVPIIGQVWLVLSAVGIPFLSTGGQTGTVLGDIPLVDSNGPSDGLLTLTSACIVKFKRGVNLRLEVIFDSGVKDFATTDSGELSVVLDVIPEGPGSLHELCDDPASTVDMTSTAYVFPGDPDTADDDTDGDGCSDLAELRSTPQPPLT